MSITNFDTGAAGRAARRSRFQGLLHRELFSGLIRLHILHHAAEEPIFGLGIMEELARHGHKLSPGTLYPLLHSMERKGLLTSAEVRRDGHTRRLYRATALGRKALQFSKIKVQELFGELFEDTR